MRLKHLLSTAAPLAIVLCGCSSSKDSPVADRVVVVKTVAVRSVEIGQSTTQPATVHAYHRAEIRAQATGYVAEVVADIGDYVKAGATLAVIDVPEMSKQRGVLEARIRQAEAEETRAEAGLKLAESAIEAAKSKAQQVTSDLKGEDALVEAAEAEFRRTNDLVQRQALQGLVLDEVRKKRDSSLASRESAQSAIGSAEAEVQVAVARYMTARADLEAAKAATEVSRQQLAELDVLIGYATIVAPFDGIVSERTVDPGDLVTAQDATGSPLFVVSHVDRVRIQTPVPEVDAARMNKGDTVTVRFPSFPAESLTASVTRLSGELHPGTRTMLVEAEVENPDRKLIPGMFGQATIASSKKTAATMLPARAVRFDENGKAYVYVVNDDTISIAEVETGVDNGKLIEVVGLDVGQQVVDAHLKRFSDGQQVTVTN